MANALVSLFKKISKIVNNKFFAISLIVFDALFVLVNIYTKFLSLGIIFIVFNIIAIIFFSSAKSIFLIFVLYPLSRVLKLPHFDTSMLTILIGVFCIINILIFFLSKNRTITYETLVILILFACYVLLTFITSLINYEGFTFLNLFSYYLYLFFIIVCFISVNKENKINMSANFLASFYSYFFGMLATIFFYYLIPNGDQILNNAGVNVFDTGNTLVRFSPLTDDPNYGTAYIVLLSALYISFPKKSKLNKLIGYPVLTINMVLSCLSLSKMFILCLLTIIIFLIVKFCFQSKNIFITTGILVIAFCCLIIFATSPLAIALIIRTIGTTNNINLNTITTGRFDLFGEYSSYILSNPIVLIFGKGPLYSNLDIFSLGDHNTFTKNLFGSGIIGVSILISILYLMSKKRFDKIETIPFNFMFYAFIICLFICCMSLCIPPSTIFSMIIISIQFTSLSDRKNELSVEIKYNFDTMEI